MPSLPEKIAAAHDRLDEYLDDLDAIKEQVAEKTRGMTAKQIKEYFAGSARRLRQLTGQKLRLRRARRKLWPAKR